jgi:hypothetical protein
MYHILLVRDCAEIFFYSCIIFSFCTWLKTDKTKNLVGYFIAYCLLTIGAWALNLPTLTPFLFSYAPIILLLFIVIHEKTLQRNFVTLCAVTPKTTQQEDWLDTLLSSSLSIINANKAVTVIIEHKNSLENFLNAPFLINADIGKEILDLLLSSASYDDQKMVWIATSGRVRGINVSWYTAIDVPQRKKRDDFLHKEDALFYTLQTDAIIFSLNPITRTFSLIMDGKETAHISAHQARILIKKQLATTAPLPKKGIYHESSTSEKSLSQ